MTACPAAMADGAPGPTPAPATRVAGEGAPPPDPARLAARFLDLWERNLAEHARRSAP